MKRSECRRKVRTVELRRTQATRRQHGRRRTDRQDLRQTQKGSPGCESHEKCRESGQPASQPRASSIERSGIRRRLDRQRFGVRRGTDRRQGNRNGFGRDGRTGRPGKRAGFGRRVELIRSGIQERLRPDLRNRSDGEIADDLARKGTISREEPVRLGNHRRSGWKRPGRM